MNDFVDPVSGSYGSGSTQPTQSSNPTYKNQTEEKDEGDHVVMGMHMNDKQYEQFMKNMQQSISDQIKQDDEDRKRTDEQIKEAESEEG